MSWLGCWHPSHPPSYESAAAHSAKQKSLFATRVRPPSRLGTISFVEHTLCIGENNGNQEVVAVAPARFAKSKRLWLYLAHWTGFGTMGISHDTAAVKPATLVLFRCLNWPWSTIMAVTAVLIWGAHVPPLTERYVIAGLAGAATVGRVAPTLAQILAKSSTRSTTDIQRSVALSAIAGRRALGWVLLSFLALPWIGIAPGDIRIEWVVLVVPATFAGRALWVPWWWRVTWEAAQRLT